MNSIGRHCLNLRDASRRTGIIAPFATYYVYYPAEAETV